MLLAAGNSVAADGKAKKQTEVRNVTRSSLQKFYKSDPSLKAQVDKAPGYGVFTTYGLSFLIGGAGGKGLVHEHATNKDTFMSMAQASSVCLPKQTIYHAGAQWQPCFIRCLLYE